MATGWAKADSMVDILVTNVIILDPVLGVIEGNIEVKAGLLLVSGCINPDIKTM